jgi:preprotein translocase subunit SecD
VEVALSEEAAGQLEAFTARCLGQPVAIVVGGEVITVYTIRQVITGGRFQISRCGDDGCQVLFRELQENPTNE